MLFRSAAASTPLRNSPVSLSGHLYSSPRGPTGSVGWFSRRWARNGRGRSKERPPGVLSYSDEGVSFPSSSHSLDGVRENEILRGRRNLLIKLPWRNPTESFYLAERYNAALWRGGGLHTTRELVCSLENVGGGLLFRATLPRNGMSHSPKSEVHEWGWRLDSNYSVN